jgi:nucleoid-associated protein YgaU
MGLFGKSDKEKEAEEQAAHHEAQRRLQEAMQRRQQQDAARQAAPPPAAAPAPKPAAPPAAPPPAGQAPPRPQAVPVSQPAPADGETYTVQKGDSLSKIAKHHLGDANAWRRIYDANKATIGDDPDKIFPGQKLKIPGGAGTRSA